MYKTTFQIEGSQQKDVVNGIRKAGSKPISPHQPLSTDTVRDILNPVASFRDPCNGMRVSLMRLKGSNQDAVKETLWNAGMRHIGTVHFVSDSEEKYIKLVLAPAEKRKLQSGQEKIVIRERTEFVNKGDIVVAIDFDFMDSAKLRPDPVIVCYEKKKGRTSLVVRELLTDVAKIDLIKNALRGILSKKFKQSVDDLAKLENCSPQQLYTKYCNILIGSCVRCIKDERLASS